MIKGSLLTKMQVVSGYGSKHFLKLHHKSTFWVIVFVTPKGTSLRDNRVFWDIMCQNRSKGLICGMISEKRFM